MSLSRRKGGVEFADKKADEGESFFDKFNYFTGYDPSTTAHNSLARLGTLLTYL